MMASGIPRHLEADESRLGSSFMASTPYPGSPYPEGRRDSLTSVQSMSPCGQSFGSDFSGPVTPTCAQSPVVQNSFVDVASYEHDHSIHGMPLMYRPKEYGIPVHHMYPGMMMQVPHQTVAPEFDPYTASGSEHGADLSPSSVAPTWNITPWAEGAQEIGEHTYVMAEQQPHTSQGLQNYNPNLMFLENASQQRLPMSHQDLQSPYESVAPNSFDTHSAIPTETIMASNSMMDDSADEKPDMGCDSDHDGSLSPQSPMTDEEQPTQFLRAGLKRMYIRATGAKGVKREPYSPRSAIRKRDTRYKNHMINVGGTHIQVPVENVEGSKYECHICHNKFKRQEHCKRHLKIHRKHIAAICEVCGRGFGRRDNCIAHTKTHVLVPGKKDGKNKKMAILEVLKLVKDPEVNKMLVQKYGYLLDKSAHLLDDEPLRSKL